jgi:hypothetical protein
VIVSLVSVSLPACIVLVVSLAVSFSAVMFLALYN